jgi:hypothetical protein
LWLPPFLSAFGISLKSAAFDENNGSPRNRTANSRSLSSPGQSPIFNLPTGVYFVSIMNDRFRFYIPSSNNYFGGNKVHRVLCDSGYTTILLPIDSIDQLDLIFEVYESTCQMAVKKGLGVGGGSILLLIHARGLNRLKIKLGGDLFDGKQLDVSYLRFSLCTEDMARILEKHNAENRFSKAEVEFLEGKDKVHERRTSALLGQSVLKDLSSIKHNSCNIYFDSSVYTVPPNMQALEAQIKSTTEQISCQLPSDFRDWVSDDNMFDDEEIYPPEEDL